MQKVWTWICSSRHDHDYHFAHQTAQKAGYIPGLDGFRTLAVLIVMVAHYGFWSMVPGKFGVNIFFFVSGFLISTLLFCEYDRNGRVDVKGFYLRRVLRLAPELLVFLAISIGVSYAMGCHIPWQKIAAVVFYAYNYYWPLVQDPTAMCVRWDHMWSLAVEEHFYILYPLVLSVLCHSKRGYLAAMLVTIAAATAWRFGVWVLDFPPRYAGSATETMLDMISYGAVFAFVLRYGRNVPNLQIGSRVVLMAMGIAIILVSLVFRDPMFRATVRYNAQGIGIFLVFASIYMGVAWHGVLKWLDSPVMRWLGTRSYSAYLYNFEAFRIIVLVTGWNIDDPSYSLSQRLIFLAMAMPLGWLMAALSYRFIATPMLAVRHRLAR